MARLAQVRFVLDPYVVTRENIRQLGHSADRIAQRTALSIFGEDVDLDVLLEDGSLVGKIGVIGALLLGSYHAAASYPDFLIGMNIISSQAKVFSDEFVHKFLVENGATKKQIKEIRVTSPTADKIQNLVGTLNKLDQKAENPKNSDTANKLTKARQDLEAISRTLPKIEAEHLKTLLKFEHLPPVSSWPSPPLKEKSSSEKRRATSAGGTPRAKLRYHNRFSARKPPQIRRDAD